MVLYKSTSRPKAPAREGEATINIGRKALDLKKQEGEKNSVTWIPGEL